MRLPGVSSACKLATLVQTSGKALLFGTITVRQHQLFSDFRPEPHAISAQQALEFLRQEPTLR